MSNKNGIHADVKKALRIIEDMITLIESNNKYKMVKDKVKGKLEELKKPLGSFEDGHAKLEQVTKKLDEVQKLLLRIDEEKRLLLESSEDFKQVMNKLAEVKKRLPSGTTTGGSNTGKTAVKSHLNMQKHG